MKLRPMHRPTEVKAVAKLLDEATDSTSAELAERILLTVDELRTDRTAYAVLVQAKPAPFIYHQFPTAREAVKWVQGAGIDWLGLAVGVVPMYSHNRPLARHLKETEHIEKLRELEPPKHTTKRRTR